MPGGTIGRSRLAARAGAARDRTRRCSGGRRCGGGRCCRGARLAPVAHQHLDLIARERAAQVRERPAGLEHHRRAGVHVVEQEHALVERREQAIGGRAIDASRPPPLRARRARAPCRARSAAGRGTTCRCSPAPCSRDRPGSASPAPRRGRTRAPASAASAAAPSTAGSRPAGSSRGSRPCRGPRAGSTCRVCARIHATTWLSSSDTKNMRSASPRWAIEKIATRGLPSARVEQASPGSSGSPSSHCSNPGAASRPLSCIASSKRSFDGKNDSRSTTPTFWNGGVCTCWISAGEIEVAAVPPGRREERREQRVLAAARAAASTPASDSTLSRRAAGPLGEQLRVVSRAAAAARRTSSGSRPARRPAARRVDA